MGVHLIKKKHNQAYSIKPQHIVWTEKWILVAFMNNFRGPDHRTQKKCFFIKSQVSRGIWIYIWIFHSIPLIHPFDFVPVPCSFYYYSFVVQFEIRDDDTFGSSFIGQDCFSNPGFFVFPYEVEYCSFKVCKELLEF